MATSFPPHAAGTGIERIKILFHKSHDLSSLGSQGIIFACRALGGFLEPRFHETLTAQAREDWVERALTDTEARDFDELLGKLVAITLAMGQGVEQAELERALADLGGPVIEEITHTRSGSGRGVDAHGQNHA
jgi:hypothetical protein